MILKYPDPHLRYDCQYVRCFDKWLRGVCRQMFEEMEAVKGIGLAAPQVGLPFSLFIMKVPEPRVYINPVITYFGMSTEMDEACLSVPGLVAPVSRHNRIQVDASDEYGNPFKVLLQGLPARCAQHEKDHLLGILFTDRIARREKDRSQPVLDKLMVDWQGEGGLLVLTAEETARLQRMEKEYCYGT